MDDNLANPPTPPLDENDLAGEPISPEVSVSDVHLNAPNDDTFERTTDIMPNTSDPTTTNSSEEKTQSECGAEPQTESNNAQQSGPEVTLATDSDNVANESIPESGNFKGDNEGTQNYSMQVDSDDRKSETNDVEMVEVFEATKQSRLNNEEVESKLVHNQSTDDIPTGDDTLNETFDSIHNDSLRNEKHETEEVNMENVENVRDTTDKGAEDPFDTSQDDHEKPDDVMDDKNIHNETDKNDGNDSHDEANVMGK